MNQFGPKTDEKLNVLSHRIGYAEEKIEEATNWKNEAWDSVFELFEEFAKEGRAARFIANDGHYLYKQATNRAPKLDEKKLEEFLSFKYSPAKFKKLWESITERKVNPSFLETAVQRGDIPADIVDQCLTVPETTYSRIRRPWTKEDSERAEILGIKVQTGESN